MIKIAKSPERKKKMTISRFQESIMPIRRLVMKVKNIANLPDRRKAMRIEDAVKGKRYIAHSCA